MRWQKRREDFLKGMEKFFDAEINRRFSMAMYSRRRNKTGERDDIYYFSTYQDIWGKVKWYVFWGLPIPEVKQLLVYHDPVPGHRFSTVQVKRCYKRFHKKYNNDGILQFVVDELNRQNAWSSRYRFLGNRRLRTLASIAQQSASPRKGSQRYTRPVGDPLLFAPVARQGKSPKEDGA